MGTYGSAYSSCSAASAWVWALPESLPVEVCLLRATRIPPALTAKWIIKCTHQAFISTTNIASYSITLSGEWRSSRRIPDDSTVCVLGASTKKFKLISTHPTVKRDIPWLYQQLSATMLTAIIRTILFLYIRYLFVCLLYLIITLNMLWSSIWYN